MHSGVFLVVEADSREEAIDLAQEFANDTNWSDWNEHEGRWKGILDGGVLRYSDDSKRFNELVDGAIQNTSAGLNELLNYVGDLTIRELVTDNRYRLGNDDSEDPRDIDEFLALHRSKKALNIVYGDFSQDMFFFDIKDYANNRTSLDRRIMENPDKQYLLMWDFHS